MAGPLQVPGRRRIALLGLCALATLPAACAITRGPAVPRPHPADVEAAFLVLERQLDASLRNGPGYSLTALEGLIAAYALGEEGALAAELWASEIRRQYRARGWRMRLALRTEVRGYDRARIEVILGRRRSLLPDAAPGAPDESWLIAVSFGNSRAHRRASMNALCAAMGSTPRAWRVRYPERPPFTFARFGIDEARIASWCAARNRR